MLSNRSGDISVNRQFRKFQAYGFLKNLRFFDPFLMLFFLEKGLSYLEIGTIYAIREITINLFEIPSGLVADTWGRRRTLEGSFIFYILSFVLFYLTSDYRWFIVAMILFSVGEAFRSGVHKAMIFEYLRIQGWEERKVKYYGRTRSASQNGSAVSSVIAALVVLWSGKYSTIFLLSTIPYLADLFLILSYPAELDGETKSISRGRVLAQFAETFHDFRNFFTRWDFFRKILSLSSFTGYYKASKDYLQPVIKSGALMLPVFLALQNKQRTAILIGIIYAFIYILNAFSSRYSERFLKRFGNYERALKLTLMAGLFSGITAGILFKANMELLAVVPFLLIFSMENIRKPLGIAYVSENMERNLLASSLSAESQVSSVIAGGIAILLGFFADRFSIGTSFIVVSAILLLVSSLVFRTPLWKQKHRLSIVNKR